MFRRNRQTDQLLEQLRDLLPELKALTERASMIDDVHHRMKLLEEIAHDMKQLAAVSTALNSANDVIDRYLNDNHRVGEGVRVDVETISALVIAMQKEMRDLNRQLAEFSSRLTH